jgi:hypothetical protein
VKLFLEEEGKEGVSMCGTRNIFSFRGCGGEEETVVLRIVVVFVVFVQSNHTTSSLKL